MNPQEINLSSIDKLFEYEKHCRLIDSLSIDDLKLFSKLYFKMYLKQQEVISSIENIGL
jgi:hypothetical protein